MKMRGSVVLALGAGLLLTGCVSPDGRPDYTASGALVGGAIGGMTAWHPGAGIAVGALVGGIIGHGMDQAQTAELRAKAPETAQRIEQNQPLSLADVKALAKAGVGDDLIISQIRNSRSVYRLATADILDLKASGVSERVIDYMINTPSQTGTVVGVAPDPVYVPPPPDPVYVAPAPGYVWVPGGWVWYGSRRVWRGGNWHRPYWR